MNDPKMMGKTEKEKLKIAIMAMLLSLMLIHFTPVCAEEEKNATTMEFSLKPPPEEALKVPEEASTPPLIIPIMIGAVTASAVLGGTLLVLKKKKLKSIRMAAIIPLIILNLFAFQPSLVLADDYDFGNPLDTSNIQILTYHQEPSGWTLAEIVPAFVSYTDHGNYIDGIVRVWMDQRSPTNFRGSDAYIDIPVRVRADGWVLAWLWKDQSIAYFIFWGHKRAATGAPVIGATTLSRAIERVYYVAGKTFPGYDAFYYYDYAHPTANRLLIFGKTCGVSSSYIRSASYTFYYVLPSSVTIIDGAAGIAYYEDEPDNYGYLRIDGITVESWGTTTDWHSISLPEYALTKETKHGVFIYLRVEGPSGWRTVHAYANIAFMVWLE